MRKIVDGAADFSGVSAPDFDLLVTKEKPVPALGAESIALPPKEKPASVDGTEEAAGAEEPKAKPLPLVLLAADDPPPNAKPPGPMLDPAAAREAVAVALSSVAVEAF